LLSQLAILAMPIPRIRAPPPAAAPTGAIRFSATRRSKCNWNSSPWVGLGSVRPSLRIKCVGFRINYAARMRQRRRRRSKPEIDVAASTAAAPVWPLRAFNNIATNQYIIWRLSAYFLRLHLLLLAAVFPHFGFSTRKENQLKYLSPARK